MHARKNTLFLANTRDRDRGKQRPSGGQVRAKATFESQAAKQWRCKSNSGPRKHSWDCLRPAASCMTAPHQCTHANTHTHAHTHTQTLVSLSRRHWWRWRYAGHHTTRGSVKRDPQAINSFANLHTKLHTPQGLHRGGTRRRQDGQAHERNHASKRRHEMASWTSRTTLEFMYPLKNNFCSITHELAVHSEIKPSLA